MQHAKFDRHSMRSCHQGLETSYKITGGRISVVLE